MLVSDSLLVLFRDERFPRAMGRHLEHLHFIVSRRKGEDSFYDMIMIGILLCANSIK